MQDNITVSRELLRQVLRGLRMCDQQNQVLDDTYTALRAALEQPAPVQEPMFWVRLRSDGMYEGPIHNAQIEKVRKESGGWTPLYTAPQAQQPDRIAQLEAANTNLFEQGQKMHKRIQELESDCKIGAQEMVKAYEEIDNLKAQVSHQEPVAWCQLGLDGKSIAYFDDCAASPTGKHSESWFCNSNCTHCGTGAVDEPLYWHDTETDTPTAPPAQTPPRLTLSEIFEADPLPHSMFDDARVEFARAIESAVRAHLEEVIDKLSAKLKERDAVLRQALAAMEGADQIDTDMRDAINQIRKVLEP